MEDMEKMVLILSRLIYKMILQINFRLICRPKATNKAIFITFDIILKNGSIEGDFFIYNLYIKG